MRVKSDPNRIGPIKGDSDLAKELGLDRLLSSLEEKAQRKVEFNLYDSRMGAYEGETLVIPEE